MKGILEFDLEEHFESLAFMRAATSTGAYLVLYDMLDFLEREIKRVEVDEYAYTEAEVFRDQLLRFMEDRGIDMSNLP